jgi:glycosyltransferase involved in cell wall biosynthesis
MKTPAVSVVLPTYNRAAFLPDTIKSVQAQTLSDWELIIVDDGSNDDTRDLVEPFVRIDRRLKILPNTGHPGPGSARNTGIRAAQGGVVAFIDSDDRWEPTKLAMFIDILNRNHDTVLVGSDYRMIDCEQQRSTTMKSYLLDTMMAWWEQYAPAAAVIPCELLRNDIQLLVRPDVVLSMTIGGFLWIHTSSAMVRRDAVLRDGMFDENLQRTEDIDLWLKLAQVGQFAYIDRVLATYDTTGRDNASGERYKSHDASRRHTGYGEALHHLRLLNRIERRYVLSPAQLKLLRERRAAHHRRCMQKALQEGRLGGLLHALPPLASKVERRGLLRELRHSLFRR